MSTDQQETLAASTVLGTPSDREILSERVFVAPRARVFAAYTDPELIPRWWGPAAHSITVESMERRRGGAWRFISREPNGTQGVFRGIYREFSPPERIVQTFEWDGMPGHVALEAVSFEDLGARTRVRTTSLFHTREERDGMLASGMERGVRETHARLAQLLAD